MCAEGLTGLIKKYERQGRMQGIRVARNAPTITHMLFADDAYLYCKANEEGARSVVEILQQF